jgi:hypothetical protein
MFMNKFKYLFSLTIIFVVCGCGAPSANNFVSPSDSPASGTRPKSGSRIYFYPDILDEGKTISIKVDGKPVGTLHESCRVIDLLIRPGIHRIDAVMSDDYPAFPPTPCNITIKTSENTNSYIKFGKKIFSMQYVAEAKEETESNGRSTIFTLLGIGFGEFDNSKVAHVNHYQKPAN